MPTDPVKELLPPEADQAQVYGKLKEFADLLQETVNYGTRVLTWCLNNAADGVDTAPPQLMFRRAVELLDALTTQIRGGAVAPAKLTLRALLECQLCGLYLVKRKKDRRKRAFAFLVDGIHRELDYIDKMDAKSNAGTALRRELRGDSLRKIWARSLTPGITAQRGQLQKLLTTRGYRKAELEYQRMKGSRRRFDWYALYGGPSNVRELAKQLKQLSVYEILYRWLSGTTHSTDIFKGSLAPGPQGSAAVAQLRNPADAQLLCLLAISLALALYQRYIEVYTVTAAPAFALWYKREIENRFTKLGGPPQITVQY